MSEVIDKFLGILPCIGEVEKEYQKIKNNQKIIDLELEDVLHELELSRLNAVEIMFWTKELIRLRKERRILKNEYTLINHLKSCLSVGGKNIFGMLSVLKKLKDEEETKEYTPRIRKDIKLYKGKLRGE